jgi:hypothetical protein
VQNDKTNDQHACEQSITRVHTCLTADRSVPSLKAEVGWALQVREHNSHTCTGPRYHMCADVTRIHVPRRSDVVTVGVWGPAYMRRLNV